MSEKEIRGEIKNILSKYNLFHDDFSEEINSIEFITLIIDIEDTFDIVIEEEKLVISDFANVNSITEYIIERRK